MVSRPAGPVRVARFLLPRSTSPSICAWLSAGLPGPLPGPPKMVVVVAVVATAAALAVVVVVVVVVVMMV